jgi:2-polyprenyl-3-methyl-5-hydroxy-6-metoxy-1,4-benzoquinol methylase
MPWLDKRHREPEVMDQPGLDPERHAVALDALARINRLSLTASSLFAPLAAFQRRRSLPRLRILDVASGGGDVAINLARMAGRLGLDWRVTGCDFSPFAVSHAGRRAKEAGIAVEFVRADALAGPLPPGPFDAALCTLFLHHLGNDEAVSLLRKMAASAPLVLVSDLCRSVIGLVLAHVVGRLVTRSPVVHVDGPLSVQAAFTVEEARELARRAGLEGAKVRPVWPWRWLLTWGRP